ncbi:hypothetical protein GDO81_019184 [Engystomops pustulosus]|uniref:Uncharacterized protein n=1 Tax=Engystomops pustulosus TaxID=76066 RepID=A0AAV6YB39_ENGPU|nr:hypothetical protein GDO81_019184 [Engystomops pustulosus]
MDQQRPYGQCQDVARMLGLVVLPVTNYPSPPPSPTMPCTGQIRIGWWTGAGPLGGAAASRAGPVGGALHPVGQSADSCGDLCNVIYELYIL